MAPLSPNAASLRAFLLRAADDDQAMRIATQLIDLVNERVNAAGVDVATSLVARALIARGVRAVAGDWFADVVLQPVPDTAAAIASVVDDLPPELDGFSWVDPAIAGRRG